MLRSIVTTDQLAYLVSIGWIFPWWEGCPESVKILEDLRCNSCAESQSPDLPILIFISTGGQLTYISQRQCIKTQDTQSAVFYSLKAPRDRIEGDKTEFIVQLSILFCTIECPWYLVVFIIGVIWLQRVSYCVSSWTVLCVHQFEHSNSDERPISGFNDVSSFTSILCCDQGLLLF